MVDFSIDYGVLHRVQREMHALAEKAADGGAKGSFKDAGEADAAERREIFGNSDLSRAFGYFYSLSARRTRDAKDGLEELGGVFDGVASAFFEADSNIASQAGMMGASLGLGEWLQEKEAWDNWRAEQDAWDAYLEKIGAADYFAANPDAQIGEVCSTEDAPGWCETWNEDDDAPYQPGDEPPKPAEKPPTEYELEDENGHVKVKLTLDDDYNVVKSVSEITNPDGQSYTSEIAYDGPVRELEIGDKKYDVRDYTMTITVADGSQVEVTVVNHDDGSATMTEVTEEKTVVYKKDHPDDDWPEEGTEVED